MSKITSLTKDQLLYHLSRQYFVGEPTMGKCPACENSGRGGGWCKTCLIAELKNKGVSGQLLNFYCQAQNDRLRACERIANLAEQITG